MAIFLHSTKISRCTDGSFSSRAEDVERVPHGRDLEMNANHNAALVTLGHDLYHYPFGGDRAFRLTFDPHEEEEFSFSPDGRQAAFVRRNNLHVVNLDQQRQEKQLTTDGTDQILNGKLDWVYQEEVYGRGNSRRTGGVPIRRESPFAG